MPFLAPIFRDEMNLHGPGQLIGHRPYWVCHMRECATFLVNKHNIYIYM
jgi:hypothetical protein